MEDEVSNETLAALILQFTDLISAFGPSVKAWAEGTPEGGPNFDGLYPLTTGFGTSILVPSPGKIASDALQPRFITAKMATGSTFTLDLVAHKSAIINLEGPAPTSNINVLLPPTAPAGWMVTIFPNSSGRMTFSSTGSNGAYNRQNFVRSAGQAAPMTALSKGRSSAGLANWLYFGDMTA